MQDFENKKKVEEALNTLKAKDSTHEGETFHGHGVNANFASRASEAYAQNQGDASFGQSNAAFNANGNPENPEQNISVDGSNANGHSGLENMEAMADMVADGALDQEMVEAAAAAASSANDTTNVADLHAEISTLRGQLDIMKKQVALEHDKMLRALADADNIRKRAEQDIDREKKFALERFVRSLLPVYDALEKALEMSDRNDVATKSTLDGVENTLTLFLKELQSFGVECVDPTNQPFDPNFHQAISMQPSADVPNNHVLHTMQKGFLLNGRVVRPAMVVVCKQA